MRALLKTAIHDEVVEPDEGPLCGEIAVKLQGPLPEGDMTTPSLNALRLFQRAAAPKELWGVPGAGHAQAASLYPEEYDRHILGFIGRCGLSP